MKSLKFAFFITMLLAVFSLGGVIHPSKTVLKHISAYSGTGIFYQIVRVYDKDKKTGEKKYADYACS